VIQFEAITLSILLVVAEILAGEGYITLMHATAMFATASGNYLEEISRFLNKAASTGLLFWQAVAFVAVFHCGAEPSILKDDDFSRRDIVGYKVGRYAVVSFFNFPH
jgi:hypothetical protein